MITRDDIFAVREPAPFDGEGTVAPRRGRTLSAALRPDGDAVEELSPRTGWSRDRWARLADDMLRSVRPFGSDGHSLIRLPGRPGRHGPEIDGLEAFARTFLLAGFRLRGEGGADPDGLADWYATGITTGTDPASPERWVRLDEHPQAKVEAASIALVLDMTRPWIWDRLAPRVQQNVVDYLAPAVGDDTYPQINWVWFRLVVQTFLRSVGGPASVDEMAQDLATHDGFVRADGWLSDGPERAYDHYVGWALHLYPVLWARMAGTQDLAGPRHDRDVTSLDRYLQDAVALVGADGSPLVQGRSLAYRFAAAAPFWVGAIAEVPSLSPGVLRRAASGVLGHFVDHGAPDARGLLTLGWHDEWSRIAQAYSGPGSPYWASKGMLGLSLPADHPVWTAVEEPLPVERADTLLAVRAPGWLVAGTVRDGIVRVVNHGTDHGVEGVPGSDSPLYTRLGYSTATSPLLDDASWVDPLDQSVALVDDAGRATHRTGMRTLEVRVDDAGGTSVGVAASDGVVHWATPDDEQQHHGSGYAGTFDPAARITVVSLVRGPWEVRLARVDDVGDQHAAAGLVLRMGGWAVSGDDAVAGPAPADVGCATAAAGRTTSTIASVLGAARAGTTRREDSTPLGDVTVVPWLVFDVEAGAWVGALLGLDGDRQLPGTTCTVRLVDAEPGCVVHVTWPDRAVTTTSLTSTTTTGTTAHVPRT